MASAAIESAGARAGTRWPPKRARRLEFRLQPEARKFVAGLCGGAAGATLLHPLDSMRVLAQSSLDTGLGSRVGLLRQVGLTAGLIPSITCNAAAYCLLFGAQDELHRRLAETVHSPVAAAGLAGALTGVLLAPVLCPLELWKCQSQAGLAMRVPRTRGLAATAMRCCSGNAAFFACIELAGPASGSGAASASSAELVSRDLLIGAASGLAYWAVASPFDLIKTRQQLTSAQTSMLTEAKAAVAARGSLLGLWRGFGMAAARTLPMQAGIMAAYGMVLRALEPADARPKGLVTIPTVNERGA